MNTTTTLNTNCAIAPPSILTILRERSLQNEELKKYYISPEDEKEWIAYRKKIDIILINNSQSLIRN